MKESLGGAVDEGAVMGMHGLQVHRLPQRAGLDVVLGEVELEFRTLEWLGKLKKMLWDA